VAQVVERLPNKHEFKTPVPPRKEKKNRMSDLARESKLGSFLKVYLKCLLSKEKIQIET
jgi:hypothetical protein